MTNGSMLWQIFFWGWVASEVGILLVTRTRKNGGSVQDRGSLALLWITIFASISAGAWISATHPQTMLHGSAWLTLVSLSLLLAGLLIRWTAIVTLGRSFSANVAIHANQTVQRSGVFRLVRHPSYTGLLAIFAAIGVQTRNWIGFAAILLPTTAALLYRIHVEEAALGDAFGTEYREYSRTTKRLIPGLF